MKKNSFFIVVIILVFIEVAVLLFQANNNNRDAKIIAQESCQNAKDSSERLSCWEDLIEKTLSKKGLGEAFNLIGSLYEGNQVFAQDCHGYVHLLGEKAYELFSQNKEVAVSQKSSYCGYGFYHGFMETLLHTTNDIEEARAFCDYADAELKKETADAGGACYHGIGHGAVDDVPEPNLWGKPLGIIKEPLQLCEKLAGYDSSRHGNLFRCVTGVFNSLEILMSSARFELSLDRSDPFWICRTQKQTYKEACYTQMVVAAMNVSSNDFVRAANFIGTIEEDDYATHSLSTLVVERVRANKTDYKETLEFCRNLPKRFHIPCITGFAEGFLKYGPPQKEYVEALEFCKSDLLTDTEKQACFGRILSILRIWYTHEKSQEICQSVQSEYQLDNCEYN